MPLISRNLGFFLLLCAMPAFADEAMTWSECVQEALQANPSLESSKRNLEKNEANYHGSYSGFLPQASAFASYTRSSAGQVNVIGGTTTGTLSNNNEQYAAGLNVTQNIFNGFADSAKVSQTKASLESARQSLAVTSAQLLYDLRVAYSKAVYYEQLRELNDSVAKRRKENQDLVNLRFEGGTENKGNVLKSKVAFRSAEVDVSQTLRNLEVARRSLAMLLGRPAGSGVVPSGKLEVMEAPVQNPSFRSIVDRVPTHLQNDADKRAADAAITRSRSGFLPTLAMNGSISRQGTGFPLNTDRWSVGLTLNVPLFSGGSTYYDVQSAVAERDRLEANLQNTDRQLLDALQQAYADYQTSMERAEVQQESVAASLLRAEIARAKYTNGLLVFENWDLIENDLITQQQQLLSVKLQAVTAEASWKKAQGIGVSP